MGLKREIVGRESDAFEFKYGWKDVVTYALGIGAGTEELDFLLETRGPKVLPTFAVVPTFGANFTVLSQLGGNLLAVLHGGQKITLHGPIPASGTVKTYSTVSAVYDKGKGALVLVECRTVDEKGEPLFENQWQIFYRGEGGFGGERGPEATNFDPPARDADFRVEQATHDWQPLLYRLSGDLNPIHADPNIAKMVGFPRPIMHGLCTFGFAGRALLARACGGDADRLASLEVRFTKPVFPGETLVTEGWSDGPKWRLRVATKERGEPVMLGLAELR